MVTEYAEAIRCNIASVCWAGGMEDCCGLLLHCSLSSLGSTRTELHAARRPFHYCARPVASRELARLSCPLRATTFIQQSRRASSCNTSVRVFEPCRQ